MPKPKPSLCGILPDDRADTLVELALNLKFYKGQEVMWPDEQRHAILARCTMSCKDPLELRPLDAHHGVTPDNAKDKFREWIEVRAILSVAVALIDAQFSNALPHHFSSLDNQP